MGMTEKQREVVEFVKRNVARVFSASNGWTVQDFNVFEAGNGMHYAIEMVFVRENARSTRLRAKRASALIRIFKDGSVKPMLQNGVSHSMWYML